MNVKDALKQGMNDSAMVCLGYLEDLNDQELMKRPCPGCNHTNWQIGHLIHSEHGMMEKVAPGSMPALPAGFTEKYSKEASTSDDASKFLKKDELLKLHKEVRSGTLAALEKVTEDKLDAASGLDFAPTVGAVYSLQGSHWMMHAGQWAVVRRQLGRPPLF